MAIFKVCIPCHIFDNHNLMYCKVCGRKLTDANLKANNVTEAKALGWIYHHSAETRRTRKFDAETGGPHVDFKS